MGSRVVEGAAEYAREGWPASPRLCVCSAGVSVLLSNREPLPQPTHRVVKDSPALESIVVADGVELYVGRAPWFKTMAVRMRFTEPLDFCATARSLTVGLLRRGCRRSPDLMSLARRLESLYGAGVSIDSERIGERQTSDYNLRVIHPRAVGGTEPLLQDGLQLLDELIRDPVVENGGFRAAEFEQERQNLERSIRSLLDDKAAYSQRRFMALLFEGEPYGEAEIGSLDDLPGLDPVVLLEQHRSRLANSSLQIFAIGDFLDSHRDALFALGSAYGPRQPRGVLTREFVAPTPTRIVEEIATSESHLFLGYRFEAEGQDLESALTSSVAASILGGGSHSLLFRELRERDGLAYSTHAYLDRVKGFLLLYAGIDGATSERAETIVRAQVDRVARGEFDVSSFCAARDSLEHSLRTAFDSPQRSVEFVSRAIATGFAPDPAAYAAALGRVTVEDVVRVAAKWREGLTYLALGVRNDRDGESAR